MDKRCGMALIVVVWVWGVFVWWLASDAVIASAGVIGEREQEGVWKLEVGSRKLDGKRKLEEGSWRLDAEPMQDYRIGVGDTLRVVAWKELDIKVMVRPDGKISLPVVGEAMAWDKTLGQLSEELSERAKTNVVVILEEMAGSQNEDEGIEVAILGEVEKPGVYDARTVYELIARAGGFRQGADRRSVFLYRDGLEVGRWRMEVGCWKVDEEEVLLEDGDLVWVEESPRKRIADTVSFLYKPVQFFVLVWALLK